ncbi:MAG: lipoate--protein ligase family protein, partial [bacterium]
MDNWRLVEYSSRSPLFNLAVEEALIQLNRLSSPTLRIWRNTKKTVVIGRFQRPEFEVNFGLSAKNGVYVVRRFTGGGAVYHDKGNINFSLIVPEAHPLFCGLGENLYKPLGKIIIEFLRSLNLHAKLKTNSIFVNNKKISGMSGYITPELSFHHATLLVSTDTQFIEEILKGKNYNSTPCVKSKKEPITT